MRTLAGHRRALPGSGRHFPRARFRRASILLALVLALSASGIPDGEAASAAQLQHRLNAVADRIDHIQTALATTEARIGSLRREVSAAAGKVRAAQKSTIALVQSLYMGSLDQMGAIFNADNVIDFGDRETYFERLQAGNRDVLQRVTVARKNLKRHEKALIAVLAKQKGLARSLAHEEAALAKMFRDERARIAALEAASRARRRASRFTPLPTGTGVFKVCPVDNPRAYSDDFGAPRAGGRRRHQGNDILAPRGTPIRAPFDGRFEANSSGLGGNQAKVFNGYGHVFNAHLEAYAGISSGSFVSAGTVIGYVGDTGDARGGPTHDHFEWHPGNGPAIDPYRYLNQVC